GTLEVANALSENGDRSIVISAGGRLVQGLVDNGSEHIALTVGKKTPLTLRHVKTLRDLFRSRDIDIVHARSRLPAWIAWLALRGMDQAMRPVFVTTVHGPYTVNAYSRIMCRGQRVIAISEFIRGYILDNYPGTDPQRVQVIHRGVDRDEFPYGYRPPADWMKEWNRSHGTLAGKFVLTAPARITRWKGQEDFIQIIQGLKQKGVPVHGLIAGGAHPRRKAFLQSLHEQVRQLDLDQDITFLGHRDDLKNVMAVSDVVLSLAREPEAFGRTALEALSMGIPVIAYDHGGAAEVLERMFPAGRVRPLNTREAIEHALDFYTARPRVAESDAFTREEMLQQTLQLYRECADQHAR
ncbi:MAG: glycosyltransferase family 4 protein, partial [Gammaproteobacteria bacterium]|nr:glycosyltransferase family 4 protein [Gammaproteobacteria bacterium]